jgi:hypothetical protein
MEILDMTIIFLVNFHIRLHCFWSLWWTNKYKSVCWWLRNWYSQCRKTYKIVNQRTQHEVTIWSNNNKIHSQSNIIIFHDSYPLSTPNSMFFIFLVLSVLLLFTALYECEWKTKTKCRQSNTNHNKSWNECHRDRGNIDISSAHIHVHSFSWLVTNVLIPSYYYCCKPDDKSWYDLYAPKTFKLYQNYLAFQLFDYESIWSQMLFQKRLVRTKINILYWSLSLVCFY